MKTIKSLMLFAAAAMAFAGCSKDDGTTNDMGMKVRFTAGTDQTRTAFGEPDGTTYPTLWQEGDKIALRLNTSTSKTDCPVTPTNGGANATFDATLTDDGSGSYTIQALSPASAFVSALASGNWRVTVPSTQTPTAASCDPAAQILFAASETTTTMPASVSLRFKHATAYGKFSFKNLNLGSATVNSISITTEPAITGRFEYDFSTNALSENSSSNTLTIETASTENIWFACAPADLSNTTLKVVISTDQGTLTKEVSLPANRAFKAGRIATFDLDMTGIELAAPVRYELLTAASDLEAGDQVIIAAKNSGVAISSTQNSNNRAETAVTKEENYIVSPSDAVEIFDVEVVGEFYAFKATKTAGYIYAASSGSNYMRTESELDDNGKWKLTFADGTASLVAQGTNTRNQLKYNSSSKIFSCYSSGQQPIALYVKKGSSGPRFSVTATETELASTTTSASVAIGGNVAWTATVTGDATFENGTKTLTGTGSTTAVISFAANTAVDAKTYTVEVSTTADVAPQSYSIVFTQAGLPADAKYYVLADQVTAGGKYLIVTDVDNVYKAVTPLDAGKTYGYLSPTDVTVSDGKILSNDETNALAFTIAAAGENAYYLIDATGKYYYQQGTYNSFNVSDNNTDASIVYTWSIAFANGLAKITHTGVSKTIQYDSQYGTYGSYADVTHTLPALYVLEK